ncbi:hypothetical protein PO002_08260 [Cupriavidus necator]|uniref:NACHT domain-containing protein n=1 Tax=Cupriavidus necator TaxID=106590 RepID=UPI0039C0B81E
MATRNRDDFSQKTVLEIAKRAGWLCSFPGCRRFTVGATADDNSKAINVGTASHICAAAPGGPRFDENMSSAERSAATNGIWMCRDHGTAIDSTDSRFTVDELRMWKRKAEDDARRRVLYGEGIPQGAVTKTDAGERLRVAAIADLEVFRRTAKWPSTSVPLTLEVKGFEESVTTRALASAVSSLDDLILVAPPGMGKTSTLFQVAESMLADAKGIPIFISLGDWATENSDFISSILRRPAFQGISEADFRQVAGQPGMALLLDGWNELDLSSRKRARVQLETLKAQLPELGVMVSTRKQTMDVPLEGLVVELLPLNETQQMEIATSVKGEEGEKIVDRAWRTPHVRQLITTPLYLTALLSLPEGIDFPTTKEEILRGFIAVHESNHANAEALQAVVEGFQHEYLHGLAVFGARNAQPSIPDNQARRSVSDTSSALLDDGQIAIRPGPANVLGVLVNHHVLMRLGDTAGYSFQHHQFQEWYASHHVERRMVDAAGNGNARESLKSEIFDAPSWEESIYFAVERLARGDKQQQEACANAILAALEVAPILAAEMIFRSTDEIWNEVGLAAQDFASRWHTPGKVDRAVRFMLTTGRPEFFDAIWPLISHEDDQISLRALRNCQRFCVSVIGKDAEAKIRGLSKNSRENLLYEIAIRSGIDGMDLASAVAKADPDSGVQASVAEAFAFRRADRHVAEVLANAGEATLDLVAKKSIFDDVSDDSVKARIEEAIRRRELKGESPAEQLRGILAKHGGEDRSRDVPGIVEAMEDAKEDALVNQAHLRYPNAVAHGVLARVRAGKALFYVTDTILSDAKLSLEDNELVDLVIAAETGENRAKAAACVLGPTVTGRVLDAYLEAWEKLFPRGQVDDDARARAISLEQRLLHVPLGSLIEAIGARVATADNERLTVFADLLARRIRDSDGSAGTPDATLLERVRDFVVDWGARMLATGASRTQVAQVAILASRAPSERLLVLLKAMLDDNLRRLRDFRIQAEANAWRQDDATNEARTPHTSEYQWAFAAIKTPDTSALMQEYLQDDDFADTAARILATHWRETNEPEAGKRSPFGRDFSRVKEKRARRAAAPGDSAEAADAIFLAIASRLQDSPTSKDKCIVVALGSIACGLPHGQRDDLIRQLIAAASRRARCHLLTSLVLSGEVIDIAFVIEGIVEIFEAAKKEPWILVQSDGYELREWLSLIPFSTHPMEALAIIRGKPAPQCEPRFLGDMVSLFAESPSSEAEPMLFALAESDPRFYANADWRGAVLKMDTPSSAQRFVELVTNGAIASHGIDGLHMGDELAALLQKYPALRTKVYRALQSEPSVPGQALLARAIAAAPDEEGFLLLLKLEKEGAIGQVTWQTVERLVTTQIPSSIVSNGYDVVPVPAIHIRKALLALTDDGGPADSAARCLRLIDSLRDEYGVPDTEPRHPDLASGKPWPILRPNHDIGMEMLDRLPVRVSGGGGQAYGPIAWITPAETAFKEEGKS